MISLFSSFRVFSRLSLGVFVCFWLFLAGCSNDDILSEVLDPTIPADVTYNQALANIDAGDYPEAIKKFNKVDRQHPYSPLARHSVIMTTYLSYRMGDYDQAITDGERFVSLYPSDDEAPYALYIVGMSNFRQLRDVTRDQSASSATIQAMNEIVTRYPESVYVEDAQQKILIANDQLAAQEMLIGRYYQERREFIAAINRFRIVVNEYETSRHVEEALARLVESYYSIGLMNEAYVTAATLGHNYADSEWYIYTYNLLLQDGLEQPEQSQSWTSRAVGYLVGNDEKDDE